MFCSIVGESGNYRVKRHWNSLRRFRYRLENGCTDKRWGLDRNKNSSSVAILEYFFQDLTFDSTIQNWRMSGKGYHEKINHQHDLPFHIKLTSWWLLNIFVYRLQFVYYIHKMWNNCFLLKTAKQEGKMSWIIML